MSDAIEPLDDSSGDPLAALVAHARELEVEYDVESGLARHRELVAAAPVGGWWMSPTTGIVAMVVLVVGAVVAWGLVSRDDPAPTTAEAHDEGALPEAPREPERGSTPSDASMPPEASTPAGPARAAALPDAPPTLREPDLPDDAAPPRREPDPAPPPNAREREPPREGSQPVRTPAPRPAPTPPATAPDDDALAREAAQIRRARSLLERGDAAAALAVCNDGDREFPRGTFVPERSGIRVLALHALGKPHEAAARAWLSKWPAGTLAPRIRRTLD